MVRRGGWPAALFLAAALLVKPVQDRVDASRGGPKIDPDLLYFSSPPVLKALALGYDSLLADIYWMRAIQYYGRRDEAARRPVRYKNLAAMLDIVTTLDPRMLDVYRAGSIFLAEPDPIGAGQPDAAMKLLDKGISLHPEEWRLRFDKGLAYFIYFKDPVRAARIWFEASRLASSPPWMEGLAARAFSEGGEIATAKDLYRRQFEGSDRREVRENARDHLASIQVDEDIWALEFFVEKYVRSHGKPPAGLLDLIRAGLVRAVPLDPSGVAYAYDPATGKVRLSPESKVHYLALPYDYREAYRKQLARAYGE